MSKLLIDQILKLKGLCQVEKELEAKTNLTIVEVSTLENVVAQPKLSNANLARELHLSPSRTSRIVDGLVEKGCLKRTEDSRDRRAVQLKLTARGLGVHAIIQTVKNSCERQFRSMLDPTQYRQTQQDLILLIEGLSDS